MAKYYILRKEKSMKIKRRIATKAIAFVITVLFFWGVKPDPMPSMLTVAVLSAAMYEINYIMVLDIWLEIIEKRKPEKPQMKHAEIWHYEAFDTRNMNYDMSHWADEKIGA